MVQRIRDRAMNYSYYSTAYRNNLLILCFFAFYSILSAQLPNSHIYIFDYKALNDSAYLFENGLLLTSFNPDGYNNQPAFFSEELLFFTAALGDTASNTDIYSIDLRKKKLRQITSTIESEYSAKAIPESNAFSTVRVSVEGDQLLWRYSINRSNYGYCIDSTIKNVGYYHWLKPYQIALFEVAEPVKFTVKDFRTGSKTQIDDNIGRCFFQLPDGLLVFVDKEKTDWQIKQVDNFLFKVKNEAVIETLSGSEDFVCTQDGVLFMAKGSKLYKYKLGWDTWWFEIADFSDLGLQKITRLALNGNGRIALVNVF